MISTPSALKITPRATEARSRPTPVDARRAAAGAAVETAGARIHAVIVHHRGREMLEVCLRTLLDSAGVELEVIVVSNHCLEPLPDLVEHNDRVHVAETGEPIGFSEANNVGVKWAKEHLGPADYYYFLNNDTESRPDTLANMVRALHENPRAAAAGPLTLIQAFPDHLNSLGINVTDDAWGWDEGIGQKLSDYGPLPEARPVLTITGSAYLLDAEIYDAVGGWTEAYEWYFEDIDLGIKIWKQGREVIHVPDAEILHRVSATMTVGAERKQYFFWRNRILLALIHWPAELLWPLLRRAIYWEIFRAPWANSRLQRKALLGALRLAPKALGLRRRLKGPDDWQSFLHPAGSVPVIRLPGAPIIDPSLDPEAPTTASLPEGAGEPDPGDPWRAAAELRDRAAADERRRVLVLGWGPLPFENQRMSYAPGARSRQIAGALADAGHAVCLAYARIPGAYFGNPPDLLSWSEGDFVTYQMGVATFDHPGALEGLVEAFDPHALVGAAPIPSRRAVRLAGDRPVWVDLFGDPMAEAQAKDRAQPADEDGDHLTAYWQLMHELLGRGDVFSSVSARQRYSLIGQLGVAGRLNRATAGREMVHVIPCAAPEETPTETADGPLPEAFETFADGFVALWSGGFNTWCDVDTLVDGLERAMAEEPGLRFVATGGAVDGHDSGTFVRLQERVAVSPHAERFLILGCLPKEQADRLRDRADLLVVTERPLYERELGSSGRVLGWLARGRPSLCTEQSELGALIAEHGLGLTYPTGDDEALADRLLEAVRDPEALERLGERARAYAEEHFSYARTVEPLVRWAESPSRAPDLAVGASRRKYHALADRHERSYQAEERLHARYRSRPFQLYKRLRDALGI